MKKACLVVDSPYAADRVFDLSDRKLNRDNCLYAFTALRRELAERGFDLHTHDVNPVETSDLVLFNEMPITLPGGAVQRRAMLLLYESVLIRPDNWVREWHDRFRAVFTWDDRLVDENMVDGRKLGGRKTDGRRFFKSGFAHAFPKAISRYPFNDRKLCTLVAGNKSVSHPLELYSARREAIDWFEEHAPGDFDYYGVGWERPYLRGGIPTKVLRRLKLVPFLPKAPSFCFKGAVDSKQATMEKYRFSICFENAREIPGYITEKLFDSLFAGCIPVYWGAPNIADHVDRDCYIDFRNYLDAKDPFKALAHDLRKYTAADFEQRWNSIDTYLKSERAAIFNADRWAATQAEIMVRMLRRQPNEAQP